MDFTLRLSLDLERFDSNMDICLDELLQFLPHMQSLVELNIRSPTCVVDDLFDELCYRAMEGQHLVPRLNTLLIVGIFPNYVDDDCIANMIESR
jgi:hypothetical protein